MYVKTLEQRKAEALEDIKTYEQQTEHVNSAWFMSRNQSLITELLKPTPTDDAVEEAVENLKENFLPRGLNEFHFSQDSKDIQTLIRRATQTNIQKENTNVKRETNINCKIR